MIETHIKPILGVKTGKCVRGPSLGAATVAITIARPPQARSIGALKI